MAFNLGGLLGNFIPESYGLSDQDKRALAKQGLLASGLAMLSSKSGGNFGQSFGEGLQSGLLAVNRGADNIGDQRYKQTMLANAAGGGSEFKALDAKARAAGYEPGSEDYKRAAQIDLGVLPRAVTAAAKPQMVTGADGIERIGTFDPTTRQWSVFDGQNWVVAGPSQRPNLVQAATQQVYIDPSLPEEVQTAIRANPENPQLGTPQSPLQAPNPTLFNGRPKEAEAGAVAGAQAAANLPYTMAEIGARTNAAIQQADATGRLGVRDALDEARGKGVVDAQADAQKRQVANSNSLAQYEAAIGGLKTGLGGATTNPLVGSLPAVTADQQIAQGSVAAVAPVLKQLFRSAGEGTFTDSDQKLLMDMIPTRMDLPEARKAKLANIDAIVKAKLGQASASPPLKPSGAKPAARRLKFNPATGEIE